MRATGLVFGAIVACAVLGSAVARADQKPKRPVEGSAGLKLFAGGNLFSTPGSIPTGYTGLGFAGSAGGFGWGAGVYGEGRVIQHIGLELGLLYDSSELHRDVTYNGVVKVREKVTMSTVRLDLLAKGILPFPAGRFWAGLGPEFVLSNSASAKNEITENRQYVLNPSQVENMSHAVGKKSTLLAIGFGVVLHAGDLIEIPIELRALKNMSQDDAWGDRVKLHMNGNQITGYDVAAQSSWEFRLGAGVGARF